MQCTSGLVARISANFGCVHRHQHVVRVFGTKATFIHDDAGPRVHWSRDPEVPADPLYLKPLPASKGELIGPFIDSVLQDRDMKAETQSHFDVISIGAACGQSLRSQSVTEVQYV